MPRNSLFKKSSSRKNKDPIEAVTGLAGDAYYSMSEALGPSDEESGKGGLLSRDNRNNSEEEEIYIVRQRYGYCSIVFSAIQVFVLGLMMFKCGVAPLQLNPMIGPYPDGLSEWGGKNAVLILEDSEWYRLMTPIFLHAGVVHLLGNVAVQLETGLFFEKEWGSGRWLLIYLFSAVGSSVLSVVAMPQAISVGSSGAVMGLFGGKLAEVIVRALECGSPLNRQERVAATVRKEQCCLVTSSVIIVMLFSFIPFVDWAAHLGGVLAGFLIGLAIFPADMKSLSVVFRVVGCAAGLVVAMFCLLRSLAYMYSGNVELAEELRDGTFRYLHFDG